MAVEESGKPGFRSWLGTLPEAISAARAEWDLTVGPPFEPGGQCAWVAPALDPNGQRLALKVGWRHAEAEYEPEALAAWGGRGTAKLVDYRRLTTSNVLLLERCEPGGSLSTQLPEPERDGPIAELLLKLWATSPAGVDFTDLTAMCDRWASEVEAAENPDVDRGLVSEAVILLRALPRDSTVRVLLFTDLHGDNVLSAQRSPWLAIDPKPHIGDPAFDVVQHIGTSYSRMQTDPAALVRKMAALTDVDAHRVRLWLFCRAVQERPGKPWLQQAINELAP